MYSQFTMHGQKNIKLFYVVVVNRELTVGI